MKKRLCCCLCFILLITISLCACSIDKKPVKSLGKYDSRRCYDNGGYQDITSYVIYEFSDAKLDNNPYFKPVTDSAIAELEEYLAEYEWFYDITLSANELTRNYDFDHSIIDCEDYYYIYDKAGEPIGEGFYEKFDNFDVYLFDYQTMTLYYFHTNI